MLSCVNASWCNWLCSIRSTLIGLRYRSLCREQNWSLKQTVYGCRWYALLNKPASKAPEKYRGELELLVSFHVHSMSTSQLTLSRSSAGKTGLKGLTQHVGTSCSPLRHCQWSCGGYVINPVYLSVSKITAKVVSRLLSLKLGIVIGPINGKNSLTVCTDDLELPDTDYGPLIQFRRRTEHFMRFIVKLLTQLPAADFRLRNDL